MSAVRTFDSISLYHQALKPRLIFSNKETPRSLRSENRFFFVSGERGGEEGGSHGIP